MYYALRCTHVQVHSTYVQPRTRTYEVQKVRLTMVPLESSEEALGGEWSHSPLSRLSSRTPHSAAVRSHIARVREDADMIDPGWKSIL